MLFDANENGLKIRDSADNTLYTYFGQMRGGGYYAMNISRNLK